MGFEDILDVVIADIRVGRDERYRASCMYLSRGFIPNTRPADSRLSSDCCSGGGGRMTGNQWNTPITDQADGAGDELWCDKSSHCFR